MAPQSHATVAEVECDNESERGAEIKQVGITSIIVNSPNQFGTTTMTTTTKKNE
jgi:hypothetical protein